MSQLSMKVLGNKCLDLLDMNILIKLQRNEA